MIFAILAELWGVRDIEMSCPKCNTMLEFKFKDGQGKFICPKCGHEENVEHYEVGL